MADSKNNNESAIYLRRAWKHIFSNAMLGQKGRAFKILVIGILATIFQMAAVLVLIFGARAYENAGKISFAGFEADFGANQSLILPALVGALSVLIIAIFIGLWQQVIITRIGRRYFEENLDDTRHELRGRSASFKAYDTGSFMRMLQRDARYLSISYMRALGLLQPGLLVIVFMAFAFYMIPAAALILAVGCFLMVPFHVFMAKWAAGTSEDIQAAAKQKSAEERALIAAIESDPFLVAELPHSSERERPAGENKFISAFVQRQRIGAYSQFITDIAMAVVVIALVLLLMQKQTADLLSLSNIIILLVLFRLITSYVARFAQTTTLVSSYEPFFRELLDFKSGGIDVGSVTVVSDEIRRPARLVSLQANPFGRNDGHFYQSALNSDGKIVYIQGDFSSIGRASEIVISPEAIDTLSGDQALRSEIAAFYAHDAAEISTRAKIYLAFLSTGKSSKDLVLFSGSHWDKLDKSDWQFFLSNLNEAQIVIVYHRPPAKLVLPPRFQVVLRTGSRLDLRCGIEDYREKRAEMVRDLLAIRLPGAGNPEGISADDVETL